MNTFDQIARNVCKLEGLALFPWILRHRMELRGSFDSWEDTRRLTLPGQPDRTNDLVALLKAEDPDHSLVFGIVEVQAEAQRMIFPRIGVYELFLLQELERESKSDAEPAIFSVVLNLTGENPVEGWQSPLGGMVIRPIVINLKNESAAELLNEIESGQLALSLLPWIPLMEGGGSPELIEKWKELIAREPSAERRRQIRDFALIFAELSKKLVLWQKALEGWEMLESQIVLGWLKRGEDKGRVETAREVLLEVIRTRLEDPVPEDLFLAIEGTNDPDILRRWFKLALRVDEISELWKAMKKS